MNIFHIRYLFMLLLLSCIGQISLEAQVSFKEGNNLIFDQDNDSYIAIGVMDFNGDHKDDILFFTDEQSLNIAYQTGPDAAFEVGDLPFEFTGEAWSVTAGDIDLDGIPEIIVAYAFMPAEVYTKNSFSSDYTLWYTLENSAFFAQGSNMVDVNGDGYLDVFICNDLGENKFFINNGTGILEDTNVDFGTPTGQDNSGNYAATWSDFDNDGDLDMYLAKCKQGELDPLASTRINLLHINNGDGSYTESGALLNLDIGAQSWTAEFGDVDNDGDMDLLIINHFRSHQLLLQQSDGSFIESLGFDSIVEDNFGLQGVLVDLDNNGFLDIVISGDSDYIYYNQGGDVFLLDEFPFAAQDANSVAFGDLNQDGFLDAYISYYTGLGSNVNFPDALYINEGNTSNYASFSLVGSDKNASAIGSKISLYSENLTQIREVKSGQSYGILNSLKQHFGLAQESIIDSVSIRWPDGVLETYYQLTVNNHYLIEKGGCISSQRTIIYEGEPQLCDLDTLSLSVSLNVGESILWSNGAVTPDIEVNQVNVYNATITDAEGCSHITDNVLVENEDPVQIAQITLSDGAVACLGESITASISGFDQVIWYDGDVSLIKELTETDSIWATAIGQCASYQSDTLNIEFIDAEAFEAEVDSVKKGEDALITIVNSTTDSCTYAWYPSQTSNVLLSTEDRLLLEEVEVDTFVYVAKQTIIPNEIINLGIDSSQTQGAYSSNGINAGLVFDVHQECIIHSVDVTTDTEGMRLFVILDEQDLPIFNTLVFLEVGTTTVELSASLPVGDNYVLTTEVNQNILSFGHQGPRLSRNDQGVFYPYIEENLLSINRSTFGPDNYYYFYNWQISAIDKQCFSERRKVEVFVEQGSSTFDQYLDADLRVYPNPATDLVYVDGVEEGALRLLSLEGKEMIARSDQLFLDVSDIPVGFYIMELSIKDKQYFTKIIIQ